MEPLREKVEAIWWAGVRGVEPAHLVRQQVIREGNELLIGSGSIFFSGDNPPGRIEVLGGGKAGARMALGLEQAILEAGFPAERLDGWLNVPEGFEEIPQRIHLHPARPLGMNQPTEPARRGAETILQRASQLRENDLCVVLISGGGSALLPAPVHGVTLEDKLLTTKFLSEAGADIVSLNTVRKRLSRIKGGGLARACRAGQLVALVISDVLGDPLGTIASGPCLIDATSNQDALQVLQKFDPQRQLPASIYRYLEAPSPAPIAPTCAVAHEVIGNLTVAVDTAGMKAEQLGYNAALVVAKSDEGSAENVGRHLARMALRMLEQGMPNCLISGGEPTVVVPPIHGVGGRNQQLVLAAWAELLEQGVSGDAAQRICILSAGTDGEDGPTNAAGGVVGPSQLRSPDVSLESLQNHLARCDAYPFLDQHDALLKTGPTGTNVCDLRVALVLPPQS